MGLAAAVYRGTFIDPFLMVIGLIGISMPVFWLGEMVNLVTQSRLHDSVLFSWVPPLGYTPLTTDPWMWFKQLLLPVADALDPVHRLLRARAALEPDRDAERGLRAHRARQGPQRATRAARHVLRTSMIVFVSLFGLDFAALVGGGALLDGGRLRAARRRPPDLPVARRTSTCR